MAPPYQADCFDRPACRPPLQLCLVGIGSRYFAHPQARAACEGVCWGSRLCVLTCGAPSTPGRRRLAAIAERVYLALFRTRRKSRPPSNWRLKTKAIAPRRLLTFWNRIALFVSISITETLAPCVLLNPLQPLGTGSTQDQGVC